MGVGDTAQVHVVGHDAPAAAGSPGTCAVRTVKSAPAARRLQLGHEQLEGGSFSSSTSSPRRISFRRGQADQVRCQLDGPRQLLGDDLGNELPRTARFAYRNPGRCAARRRRPGRPSRRNPPPGAGSLSPSVKLSPIATNVSIPGGALRSGIRTIMPSRTGCNGWEGGRPSIRSRLWGCESVGRTARLAAAALTGGILAAAAGCSGGSGGTSVGSAPPSMTLAPDPGGG